ncbi:MAG: Asp23/Gls24 family envelope stress response protein [Dermatophilaceae bacterium]
MADTALAAPAERGRTVIEHRVVERIAARSCLDVAGVVRAGSDLDRLVGRRLPGVSATVAGHRARVALEVAVTWPTPLADVAARVRDHVSATVTGLAGLEVDAVDVEIARMAAAGSGDGRRVR